MAQATDYSIANQSGANFRAELNTILAAIVSHNSGSSEPSGTKYATLGLTPARRLYKVRNAANDGWIRLQRLRPTLAWRLCLVRPLQATLR